MALAVIAVLLYIQAVLCSAVGAIFDQSKLGGTKTVFTYGKSQYTCMYQYEANCRTVVESGFPANSIQAEGLNVFMFDWDDDNINSPYGLSRNTDTTANSSYCCIYAEGQCIWTNSTEEKSSPIYGQYLQLVNSGNTCASLGGYSFNIGLLDPNYCPLGAISSDVETIAQVGNVRMIAYNLVGLLAPDTVGINNLTCTYPDTIAWERAENLKIPATLIDLSSNIVDSIPLWPVSPCFGGAEPTGCTGAPLSTLMPASTCVETSCPACVCTTSAGSVPGTPGPTVKQAPSPPPVPPQPTVQPETPSPSSTPSPVPVPTKTSLPGTSPSPVTPESTGTPSSMSPSPVTPTDTPIPTDTSPVPADTSPVPADTSPVPADTSPVPADTSPVPADTSPVPADTSPPPCDSCDCNVDLCPPPLPPPPITPCDSCDCDPSLCPTPTTPCDGCDCDNSCYT